MVRFFRAFAFAGLLAGVKAFVVFAAEPIQLPHVKPIGMAYWGLHLPDAPHPNELTNNQLPLLGVSKPSTTVSSNTPCDLIAGCTAAYSVDRKIVGAYAGNLFQLSRTHDANTQNIGFDGSGNVDTATIAAFCNTTVPLTNAKLTTGAYGCAFHLIYDQSGNSNTLTCTRSTSTCSGAAQDVPLQVDDTRGTPRVYTDNTVGSYFNNATATNVPINDADKTISVFMNDGKVATSPSGPTSNTTFGLYHCVSGCALDAGSNFGLGVFAHKNFHAFGVDLEADSHQVHYAPGGAGGSVDATVDPLGLRGDVIGISSYTQSTKTILDDINGLYVYSAVYSPGLCSASSCHTGGTKPNQIRVGAGGDASMFPSWFYEGIIFNSVLSQSDRATLQSNTATYYSVSLAATCGAGTTIVDTLGRSVGGTQIQTYGLRVLDRQYVGPIALLQRASDSTYQAIGASGCNFDTSSAATFCNATTCTVVTLYSQTMDPVGSQGSYGGTASDLRQMTQFSAAAPQYTASCIGSLPCMTFTGSLHLDQNYSLDNINSPYTFLAVANVTGAGGFQAILGDGNMFLGSGAANTTAYAQGVSSDGSATLTITNAFHSFGDTANSSTSMTIYVDGSSSTNNSITVTNTTGTLGAGIATAGNILTGKMTEFARILGTAVSSGNISTIQSNQKTYWGF